ncbi:hypothetical protein KP509_05G008900 [Ceratopteris richardii]|uniref:Cytochrome P450 n=1 Tax=Ceratopteris richardii TaxID=49495 RepID=A0A8T2UR38_CERRI|nr:hypothetical protein KP509_05G008900 [Ceratopteris richardii]
MEIMKIFVSIEDSLVDGMHGELFYWLLLLAMTVASFLLIIRRGLFASSFGTPRPPCPPALPVIGHLHLLGDLPHQSFWKLSQRYGPLISLRLGNVSAVVASTSQMAKEILHTHDQIFAYRPRTAGGVYTCFDCCDVAFSPLGPSWRFMRQMYATELFSPKRMEFFRSLREEEAHELVKSVLSDGEAGNRTVEVRHLLLEASNNINCRMVMGKKMKEVAVAADTDLQTVIDDVVSLTGVFYLGDYIPWLAWLDPNGSMKRMKKTGERTKALLQAEIDERRRKPVLNGGHRDLLDALLAAAESATLRDSNLNIPLADHHIMAAIMDVLVGGSETSPTIVEYALADLINHPEAMMKAQEELDKVVGKERLVKERDVANLKYLDCVIKESMRLHPILPFLIPREAEQECIIDGYRIAPKTRIYVNTLAIHRDPSVWEKPLEFVPERFQSKAMQLKGHYFEFLPFGLGRRRCPGWALGIANVRLMLARLIHGFSWEYTGSPRRGQAVDMTERFGLTVNLAHRLRTLAKPRLPLHVYS